MMITTTVYTGTNIFYKTAFIKYNLIGKKKGFKILFFDDLI